MIDPLPVYLLVAILGAVSLRIVTGAFAFRRALGRAGTDLRARDQRLVEQHLKELPVRFHAARLRLGEFHATTEHALWRLHRLDGQLEALRTGLVQRRTGLDRQRERLLEARADVERIKSGARLLIRALELRRNFLG